MGLMKLESIGEIEFHEKNLGLYCKLQIGAVKGKPSDTLSGEIIYNGKAISTITGSYCSNIDFDKKRYWDIRENYPIAFIELENNLPSSSIYREDRILLEEEKLEEAQIGKEKIENIQRNDRKQRTKYHGKK